MDFTFKLGGGKPSSTRGRNSESGSGGGGGVTAEEYDPSQPLDSSDDEEDLSTTNVLNFEKSSATPANHSLQLQLPPHHAPPIASLPLKTPPPPQKATVTISPNKGEAEQRVLLPPPSTTTPIITGRTTTTTTAPERTSNESDIDLSSIPMPSDEYRRPTIQFSIPTRHRLMSISTLIKRQKGVMRKQDKGGGLNYNSEVSKAFQKGGGDDGEDLNDEDKPRMSLVHEIFGSDDEDNQDREEEGGGEEEAASGSGGPAGIEIQNPEEIQQKETTAPPPSEENSNKWKTVATGEVRVDPGVSNNGLMTPPESGEEIKISIKPSSELLEAPGNESSSPDIVTIEPEEELSMDQQHPHLGGEAGDTAEDSRGKENKQIILECVSDTDDDDFEVTFVGIGRANLMDLRQGRLARRNHATTTTGGGGGGDHSSSNAHHKRKSGSPCNGFEEGEIVESDKRRKRDKKKKKSKKRKRSKDSRVSSKMNSERSRSGEESGERKSFSESDSKEEVSWRKPKLTKARNYRNGKRESEENLVSGGGGGGGDRDRDRNFKRDEPSRRRSRSRSLNRHSFSSLKGSRSRRRRSISSPRSHHRSRSKSGSRSPLPSRLRLNSRSSRIAKRSRRDGSYHRSQSFDSHHSSPSHPRSRSLTKRKSKRRHSPSPLMKRHNIRNRSISPSRSPVRGRDRTPHSPRIKNKNVDGSHELTDNAASARRTSSPLPSSSPPSSSSHGGGGSRKTSKSDPSSAAPPPVEESKKKTKIKDKVVVTEPETDKERKKKKKRREKSLSPVKAIVADGDSIVVSLSFQKSKEEPLKQSKSSSSTSRSSESENRGSGGGGGSNSHKNPENCDEIEAPITNFKPTPRKGTILINLDTFPSKEQHRKSPDASSKTEDKSDRGGDLLSFSSNKKSQDDQSQDGKSDPETPPLHHRGGDGRLDFVSSSHENSDNTHNSGGGGGGGSGVGSTPTKADSPPERSIALGTSSTTTRSSPYKVSSTSGGGGGGGVDSKSLSPSLDNTSPKNPQKTNELPETLSSSSSLQPQKALRNSPFENLRSNPSLGNDNNNAGPEKVASSPSPEITFTTPATAKPTPTLMKPMIGNIPGLFPSGFSSSGSISTPSVIIPAPPKIIQNSAPSSLINLVSVASALYAPLLAAKQPNNQGLNSSSSSRHNNNQSSSSTNNNSQLKHGRSNQGGDADSPFSPNSSDGDDLFEPPPGDQGKKPSGGGGGGDSSHRMGPGGPSGGGGGGGGGGNSSNSKYGNDGGGDKRSSLFDSLFTPGQKSSKHGRQKKTSREGKRGKHKRSSKRTEADKNGEMEMNSRLNEEVPNSAVSLKINEKYLKKLNRQERVVEEVKLSLKPHYIKKHITKEEYKDVLRKAVPKICHNKSGEINPHKIKELVEAYVKKYRKTRKGESKA